MKRFEGITLTAVLAVAAALAGCDQDQDQAWRVCVDANGRRTADDQCATSATTTPVHWYYVGRGAGAGAPAVGDYATGGSPSPAEGVSYGAAPEEGVTRGGFGGSAEGFHGEGGDGGGE